MSAEGESTPGEAGETPEPRPPRLPRLRLALKVLAGLSLLAVLLLAFAVTFLSTPQGSTFVRVFLEQWGSAATGGTLRIGGLDLRPWRAEATATGLSLRLPGTSLDAEALDLGWSPASGVSVRVVRPVVLVRDTGEPPRETAPATGLAAQPWRVLEHVGSAAIVEGRVEMRDVAGEPWLVLGRVDVETEDASSSPVAVRIGEGGLGWPEGGLRVRPASLEGVLSLADGALRLEGVRLLAGPSSVELDGRLDRLSPITATGTSRVVLDGATIDALAPGAAISGRIEGDLAVEAVANRVSGTLALASPALTVSGVGPWTATGRARLAGPQLVVESLSAEGYGGRLSAEGPLALLATAATDARVRAEGIDVAALSRAFSADGAPVAARADAALRWTTTGWDVDAARGTGEITLRPGTRAEGAAVPGVPLAGSGRIQVDGTAVALEGARVEAEGAWVEANVRLTSEKALEGAWRAGVPLEALGALLADLGSESRAPEGYEGTIRAEGELAGRTESPEATARVTSEGLSARGQPHGLEAEARYAGGRLSLAPLVLRSGRGQARVAGSVPVAAGAGDWDLAGDVEALELAPLLALAGLDGRGEASGTLRVTGAREAPAGRAEVEARVTLGPGDAEAAALALTAEAQGTELRLPRFTAELAGGRVEGEGRYDRETRALEAKATAAGLVWSRLPLLPEAARRIGGTLGAELSLGGTLDAPSGDARAALADATLDGASLPSLAAEARSDGRRLEVSGRAGEATVLAGGGPLEGDWPVRLDVDLAAVPVEALLEAFPATRDRLAAATAQGTLRVDVPLREPARASYAGTDLAASGRLGEVEWSVEPFGVEGTAEQATVAGLRVRTRATAPPRGAARREETGEGAVVEATLSVDGRVPFTEKGPLDLTVSGDVALAALDAVVEDSRFDGRASVQAHVGGSLAAPDLDGTFGITGGRARAEGVRVANVDVKGRFQGREAHVDALSARVLGGEVSASGSFPLAPLDPGHEARLRFEARDLDVARLAGGGAQRNDEAPSFFLSVEGELEATAPSLEGLRAEGRITRLESKTTEGALGLDSPAAWRLADGRFEQDPIRVRGPLGTLEASARFALTGNREGSAVLKGPFDLRLVSPFVPDTTLAGAARADLQARWDASGNALEGSLGVDDGRLTLETLSFNASRLQGEVRFLGDRAEVDATAAAGDGGLVVYGSLHFGRRLLGEAALAIEADRVPITYPEGFRGRATGGILVEGDAGRYRVSGLIDMTQGYYTAEFDQRRESLDRLDYQIAALRGESSLAESLPLAVDVRLKDPLRLRNSQAQLDIVGTVTASGTLAQPAVTGQVSLLEGGRITVRRARIRAQSGRVELNGYPAGVPEVDFQGQTQVGGVSMELRAQGVMDDLQLDISSPNRPDLGQTDLVSLLLTGRTAQAAAADSGALVAEELAAALGGALQKGVGDAFLIDVSSDESAILDDSDPTQRFKIGTRLSRTLAAIYSTRLDGTGQRFVLEWKPRAGRITFRAIDDREEGQIVELSDRFSFNVIPRRGSAGVGLRQQRLGAVRLEGALPLPEPELRRATKVRPGRRYDPLAFAQAADGVRAKLVEAGWRGASVDEAVEPMAQRKGRVELVLKVDAGPKVVLSWRGDEPGEKVRKRALEAWPPYASPEAAAVAVARAARVELQAEGFYEARVAHEVTVGEGQAELVLTVTRGAKGRQVVVEFEGNRALTAGELADTLPKPGSREFFDALDRPARLFTEARVAYAGIGYMRARLGPARTAFDPATGRLTVSVRVRERTPSRVAEVVLPEEFAAGGKDRPRPGLVAGEPFDVQAYVADRDAIASWYRAQGWMEARVRGVLEPSGGDVRVTYATEAGPRPRLREVHVASSGRTKESLVRRAIRNEPGEVILPQKLAETRTRLSELGVFSSIDVRTVPVEGAGDDVRDLEVSYVDRPDVEVEYGLRYDASGVGTPGGAPDAPSRGEFQIAAALRLPNPIGLGWRFSAYTLQTTARQNYRLGLESSSLFGLRVKTQLLAFDETDDDSAIAESFASKVKGFAIQQSRTLLRDMAGLRWHDRLRLQWGYTNKDIRYSEQIGSPDIVAGNRAFLSLSLIGDQRNSLTDPTRGFFWTATSEWSRRFLGSDVDYVRLYGQVFTYLPVVKGLVWAQGWRAGVVPGDDPLLLLENRFQAGGPTTVRGFRQNGLGPQLTDDEGLGGQGVFVMNQELRFPIWKMLKGGVFWDAGNSWLWAYEFSLRDLRHTVGGGLRIMFPFGPVRIEYGFILDRRQNSDGSYVEPRGRLVFGLGHAF